jgi:hypothetical protein
MVKWFSMAAAAALIAWPAAFAYADTCYETAQVNIDCSPKGGGGAAAGKPAPSRTDLRELLRKRLAEGGTGAKPPPVSAEALSKSIHDAEARAERALAAASSTADPARQDKALKAYNAALKDLDKAYDRAAEEADTDAGHDRLLEMKAEAEEQLAREANEKFAAQRAAAEAARPRDPDNVGMIGDRIVVCDGPVDGEHVNCRELQHDGNSCVAVIAFQSEVNWRDSTATPCSRADLAQRTAFLARHADEEERLKNRQADFALDRTASCKAIIADYVKKAEAQDGPGARADYEKLRSFGGCGVLEKAEAELQAQAAASPGADPRFATRGDTTMIDQVAVPCDQNPAACAQAIDEARAGASSAAIAAIYANAIGIGLELGGMMGNAVLNAQAANMAHAAALNNARAARALPPMPRAISCTVRGCVTTNGLGPDNNASDITGTK